MTALNVTLDLELDAFVQAEVASGRHPDDASVVRAALRLFAEERRALELLRAEVAIGIADADAGRFSTLTFEQLLASLDREVDEARACPRAEPPNLAVSPILWSMNEFTDGRGDNGATLASLDLVPEVRSYFDYLGVQPPSGLDVLSVGYVRRLLEEEVVRQNKYLTLLARSGWAAPDGSYRSSRFVREVYGLNGPA